MFRIRAITAVCTFACAASLLASPAFAAAPSLPRIAPPASITVSNGSQAGAVLLGTFKMQSFGSHSNSLTADDLFLGLGASSDGTPNKNRVNFYNNDSTPASGVKFGDCDGNWDTSGPNTLVMEYQPATSDRLTITLSNTSVVSGINCSLIYNNFTTVISTNKSITISKLVPLMNYIEVTVKRDATGYTSTLSNLTLNDATLLSTFNPSGTTAKTSNVTGFHLGDGFKLSGTLDLSGNFSSCAGACSVEVSFGTLPTQINIEKTVSGITPVTAWQFAGPKGNFSLPSVGGTSVITPLGSATYAITESTKPGFVATTTCTDGTNGSNSVSVTPNAGATITCTFANVITPTYTTITVTPAQPQGWVLWEELSGSNVITPAMLDIQSPPPTPALGNANATLVLSQTNVGKLFFAPILTSTKLSDLLVLTYSTYLGDGQTPTIQIGWDEDGSDANTGWRGRLVFVPTATVGTWETWNALSDSAGVWFTTWGGLPDNSCKLNSTGGCTWSQILNKFPNAVIHPTSPLGFVGVKAGSGGTGTSYFDALTIAGNQNLTTYNFDVETPCTTVCYADAVNGNDLNGGTINNAKKTIQAAVSAVQPNGSVMVQPGTYTETVTIGKPITVTGDGANVKIQSLSPGVIINTSGVTLNNLAVNGTGSDNGVDIAADVGNTTLKFITVTNFNIGLYLNPSGAITNTLVENSAFLSNTTHGIWSQNFNVDGFTLRRVNASYNNSAGGAAGRGLWMINGTKKNITVEDSTFNNNGLVGIDLSDGEAVTVSISNNTVISNGDAGISALGLRNAVVQSNTITNNGRFGMEIKNPNGDGTLDGANRVLVQGNIVSRNTPISVNEPRDLAGIAIMRRSVSLPINPDVPAGVVVRNNTVSGFTQPSGHEGFGILVEGVKTDVFGNTASGNDVGLQVQQSSGRGYPGSNDTGSAASPQPNDAWFDRANSQLTCLHIGANTLSSNSLANYREVGNPGLTRVFNMNTGEGFCTIQAAIDDSDTVAGHVISVTAGTFLEQVNVYKSLTIVGENKATTFIKPPATISGDAIGAALVSITNTASVTMSGFTVAGPKPAPITCDPAQALMYGVRVMGNGALDITNSNIVDIRDEPLSGCQTGIGIRAGSFAFNTSGHLTMTGVVITGYQKGGVVVSGIGSSGVITGNTITGLGAQNQIAQNGVQISGGATATVTDNTISANKCDLVSACSSDAINGDFSSGVLLYDAGAVTVSRNVISDTDTGIYSYAPTVPVTVENNALRNNRWHGVFVDQGNTTVLSNAISGSLNGVAVVSFNSATGDSNGKVYSNTISGGTNGVLVIGQFITDTYKPVLDAQFNNLTSNTNGVKMDASAPAANSVVKLNNIVSNTTGISNAAPSTLNATFNWWNAANGPGPVAMGSGDKVSANVTYCPWLSSAAPGGSPYYPVLDITTGKGFCSVQDAINDVTTQPGDVISVTAGTINEMVTVSKSVTLRGARSGIDGASRCDATTGETVMNNPHGAFYITADGVTIDGFVIEGATDAYLGAGVYIPGTTSGHTLRNNVFRNNIMGLYLDSSGAQPTLVENNCFKNNNAPGAASGNAIYADQGTNNVTVQKNYFTGHEDAAMLFTKYSTFTVSNLTIVSNTMDNDNRIRLTFATNALISGNVFTNSLYHGVQLAGGNSNITITQNSVVSPAYAGVRISNSDEAGTNTNINVLSNTVTGGQYGVWIDNDVAALNVFFNTLTGNNYGVLNETSAPATGSLINRNNLAGSISNTLSNANAGLLNGECNWFGSSAGPGATTAGNIDANPWLISSDLHGPCAPATLVVQKIVSGAIPPQDWQFIGSTGSFTLPAAGGSKTFGNLDFGPVSITETTNSGFTTQVSCSNQSAGGNSVSFNLIGSDTVTCTFTNTSLPSDLSISKQAVTGTFNMNSVLTYTLIVSNAGPGPAYNAIVTDRVPLSLTVTGAATSAGSCSNVGNDITCSLGLVDTYPISAPVSIVISTTTPSDLNTIGTTITNTAGITDSTDTVTTTNNAAQMAVRLIGKLRGPFECVAPNTDGSYAALFGTNSYNDAPLNVPAGSPGNSFFGYGDLGQPSVIPPGRVFSLFSVNWNGVNDLVWNIGGATSTASVNGTACNADLAISKSASPATVQPGGQVVFTVQITNTGPYTAFSPLVTDTLPAGFTALQTSNGCTINGDDTVTCNLGVQGVSPISQPVTILITGTAPMTPDVYTNTVTVGSRSDVISTTNNTAQAEFTVAANGTIVVKKEVQGNAPLTDWQFSGPTGTFTLPAAGGTFTVTGLSAGAHTFTETTQAGYFASASCTDNSTGSNVVTPTVSANGIVTCTFINKQAVTITVTKVVSGVAPATGEFGFYVSNNSGPLSQFTLPAGGTKVLTNLVPVTYIIINETGRLGYSPTVTCRINNGAPTNNYVTPAPGDQVTCTATNEGLNDASGHVWFDQNNDALRGPTELSLPNVTVVLSGTLGGCNQPAVLDPQYVCPPTGTILTSTVTDAGGAYHFAGLPDGNYRLTVVSSTLPAGLRMPTYDFDGIATPHTARFDLCALYDIDALGAFNALNTPSNGGPVCGKSPFDFGYRGEGLIGDHVFLDVNGDGAQDAGDLPLAGVTLNLSGDLNGDGATDTLTATTNSSGDYGFENLPHGTFTVTVVTSTLPAGVSPIAGAGSIGANVATGIVLNDASHVNTAIDFGYAGDLSIGDSVFYDLNNNGVQDAGDLPLPNITLNLSGDLNKNGNVDVLTATTNAAGIYYFSKVPAGVYTITVNAATLPAGMTPTFDLDGIATPHQAVVTLGNAPRFDVDFGYRGTGSIGDLVWEDTNGNGSFDAGEPGLAAALTLVGDLNNDGALDTLNVNASGAGAYTFANLIPGTFTITVNASSLPANMQPVFGAGSVGSFAKTLALANSEANTSVDFGFVRPAMVNGRVWLDVNRNGQQDAGEPGLPDVVINLFTAQTTISAQSVETSGPISTTTSGANGVYAFSGIMPGQPYTLNFALPSGANWTTPNVGNPDTNSDVDANGNAGPFTVNSGANVTLNISAGTTKPTQIAISKTAQPTTVRLGENITYTLVARNDGATMAQNVVVTDGLPTEVTFISASPMPSMMTPALTWAVGDLMPGQSFTITLIGYVKQDAVINGGIRNTAFVNAAQASIVAGEQMQSSAFVPLQPTAIHLASFNAALAGDGVKLIWRTSLEQSTFGFNVLRSATGQRGDAVQVNAQLIAAAGAGYGYNLTDNAGSVSSVYWLQEMDLSGATTEYGPFKVSEPALVSQPVQQPAPQQSVVNAVVVPAGAPLGGVPVAQAQPAAQPAAQPVQDAQPAVVLPAAGQAVEAKPADAAPSAAMNGAGEEAPAVAEPSPNTDQSPVAVNPAAALQPTPTLTASDAQGMMSAVGVARSGPATTPTIRNTALAEEVQMNDANALSLNLAVAGTLAAVMAGLGALVMRRRRASK
jgi:uncharacterized repeat protein (TIGR01451 family)